jgi:hypothetical protein
MEPIKINANDGKCPICGKDVYISKDDYGCIDSNCALGVGNKEYTKNIFDGLLNKYYLQTGIPSKYL